MTNINYCILFTLKLCADQLVNGVIGKLLF